MQKELNNRLVTRSLLFLEAFDQPLVVYPVGKHLGIRNIMTNKMTFIRQPDQVKEITGLTLSTNRRYLAVNEKRVTDLHAHVTLYDLKQQVTNPKFLKTINISEMVCGQLNRQPGGKDDEANQKYVASLSFSKDNKYLGILISDKNLDTRAIIYEWISKNKIISTYDFIGQEINKITFNPKDWQQICTSGPNHWRVWRLQESSFKQVQKFQKIRQDRHYMDHCWLDDDKLIVGTQMGELIYVDNCDEKQYIENAYNTGGYGQGPVGEDGKM